MRNYWAILNGQGCLVMKVNEFEETFMKDVGPDIGGSHGPYIQSQRLDIYKSHVQKLLQKGHAYRCFCTPERLESVRMAKKRQGLPSVYDGSCRNLDASEIQAHLESNQPHVVRFKSCDASETVVKDELRGQMAIKHAAREDFIIFKSDGFPTYHLASVVDDHLMDISHVFRGEEWLMSLDKHQALYAAFGWTSPRFVHLPLLLNPDNTKLSKRSGHADCESFKAQGYLADALVNFVAFLGWSPSGNGNEVMGLSELAHEFSIKDINIANPKVFPQKLRWFNQQHLVKHCDDPVLRARLVSFLSDGFRREYSRYSVRLFPYVFSKGSESARFEPTYIEKVLLGMKGRIHVLPELIPSVPYFFVEPDYRHLFADASSIIGKFFKPQSDDLHKAILSFAIGAVGKASSESIAASELEGLVESALTSIQGSTKKDIQLTLRLSLTASKMGPPLNDLLNILGRQTVAARLSLVLDCLHNRNILQ
ncbi:hypothetical protein DSO57_1032671 [Entomophthora muscae]|uniref:Uncharacterized protein n=1 Tax=Entomophthora muscae TaxID=34485 RepID=A0ACC2RRA8_9FUNG|nr:hypothetical protein DSO57_1032671 [Entomophthora muscae]